MAWTEERREAQRQRMTALNKSPEARARTAQRNKDRVWTEEQRAASSVRCTIMASTREHSEEENQKRRNYMLKHSAEQWEKVRANPVSMEIQRQNGKVLSQSNIGSKRTDDSKQKMRDAWTPERKENLCEGWQKWFIAKKKTGIEKKVLQILLSWGIKVIPQKRIKKVGFVDFLCPDQGLIIEADGDYWHNLPGAKAKDVQRDLNANKLGLRVLRLTETEINKHQDIVLDKIYLALGASA